MPKSENNSTKNNRNILEVLCIGDLHFDASNRIVTDKLHDVTSRILEDKKPDCVVIMGDLLDKRGPHQSVFDRLEKYLRMIHELSERVVVIIGNHDRVNDSVFLGDCHYFNAFKKWERMTIVDEVETMEMNNFQFLFVPYVKDGRFLEAVNTRVSDEEFKRQHFVFAHQMFSTHSPTGDIIQPDYPPIGSGHIHDYYNSKSSGIEDFKLLIYFGSVQQVSFAESEDKSFSLLQFEEGKGLPDEERIPIRLTEKRSVYIDYEEFSDLRLPRGIKLDQTRLVIKISESDLKALKSSLKYKSLLSKGIKIKEEIIKPNQEYDASLKGSEISYIEKLRLVLTREELELSEALELFS